MIRLTTTLTTMGGDIRSTGTYHYGKIQALYGYMEGAFRSSCNLKSCGTNLPYRFDSGRRHYQKAVKLSIYAGLTAFSFGAGVVQGRREGDLATALTSAGNPSVYRKVNSPLKSYGK